MGLGQKQRTRLGVSAQGEKDGVRSHWDAERNFWMALHGFQSTFTSCTARGRAGNQAVKRRNISLRGAVPSLKILDKTLSGSDSVQTLLLTRACWFLIYSGVELKHSTADVLRFLQSSTSGIRKSGIRKIMCMYGQLSPQRTLCVSLCK